MKSIQRAILLSCILMLLLAVLPGAMATVTLEVTAFSCSPNEVGINNQFSCTATVSNSGDETGPLNTATLFADDNNWLEEASYAQTLNMNINSGASAEVVFSGLKGTKAGNNGFSKITLNEGTDFYVAENEINVNVINVLALADISSSRVTSGTSVDITGQAVVGGDADVTLSFSGSSGCSIGSQQASVTTNDMTNGQTISHTWSVTIGSSSCTYTVTASASSNPSGAASKSDSDSGTITCSDCSSDDDDDDGGRGSGGGGGSGGGASASNKTCAEAWECTEWSDCIDGFKTRVCTDSKNCGTETEKPEERKPCGIAAGEGETEEGEEKGVMEEAIAALIAKENIWKVIVVIAIVGLVWIGIFAYIKRKPKAKK